MHKLNLLCLWFTVTVSVVGTVSSPSTQPQAWSSPAPCWIERHGRVTSYWWWHRTVDSPHRYPALPQCLWLWLTSMITLHGFTIIHMLHTYLLLLPQVCPLCQGCMVSLGFDPSDQCLITSVFCRLSGLCGHSNRWRLQLKCSTSLFAHWTQFRKVQDRPHQRCHHCQWKTHREFRGHLHGPCKRWRHQPQNRQHNCYGSLRYGRRLPPY